VFHWHVWLPGVDPLNPMSLGTPHYWLYIYICIYVYIYICIWNSVKYINIIEYDNLLYVYFYLHTFISIIYSWFTPTNAYTYMYTIQYVIIWPHISIYIYIYTHTPLVQTHTCSETSYRITDVECTVRAKNAPVNLTGNGEWPGVRNSVEEFCRWNCNNVVDSVFNS